MDRNRGRRKRPPDPSQRLLFGGPAPPKARPAQPPSPPHNGSPTSRAAAASAAPRAGSKTRLVLDFLREQGDYGATADEAAARLGLLIQSVTARMHDLARRGLIVRAGRTRPTRSGRAAEVWIAADYATDTHAR